MKNLWININSVYMSQNSGSFYWLFSSGSFFLLTYAEIKVCNWLKALSLLESAKKIKEPLEKNC